MGQFYKPLSILRGWRSWCLRRESVAAPEIELVTRSQTIGTEITTTASQIEHYPSGYPQYSALISFHDPFFVFRSFRGLRARLLLSKHDELAVLEAKLETLDREEVTPFFLGTCRSDGNQSREAVLSQIHCKLTEYDALIERCRHALSCSPANPRDVTSLRNWLEETGCLSEEESRYLGRNRDLVNLAFSKDSAMDCMEEWVEDRLIQFHRTFRANPGFDVSSNPHVYIYSGTIIKRIATGLMLLLITFLILTPVVVWILVDNIPARIAIIAGSTLCYLTVLSRLTKSRMIELMLAAATFVTIVTVFVARS